MDPAERKREVESGYIEKPEAPKRGRKGTNRDRVAKTKAISTIRQQLQEEERATRKDRRFAQKRVQPERDTQAPAKMRKGEEGQPVEAEAQGAGHASFSGVPKVAIQRILKHLPTKKDLDATRKVETFMNRQVVIHVKDTDLAGIHMLTDFLIDQLPEQKGSLKIPQELLNAFRSPNLEHHLDALYAVRSHLIDQLAKLDPEEITKLEQAFQAKKLQLPAKFEHFFQLVRIHKYENVETQIEELSGLHEAYECYRICAHSKDDTIRNTKVKQMLWNIVGDHFGFFDNEERSGKEPLLPDSATYAFIEREYSQDKKTLASLYVCQTAHQIVNGLYDKAIESFSKAVETKKADEGTLMLVKAVAYSEIDPKSAEKLFTIFEQAWMPVLEKETQKLPALAQINGLKLQAYARRGFVELQVALNKVIELLESIQDDKSKREAIKGVAEALGDLPLMRNEDKETINTRLFNALKAAKNSNTKTELIGAIYAHRFIDYAKKIAHYPHARLEYLEHLSTAPAKREFIEVLARYVRDEIDPWQNQVFKSKITTGLFTLIDGLEESDSKYAMLSMLYAMGYKDGGDKLAREMIEKIQDPAFKAEMRKLKL